MRHFYASGAGFVGGMLLLYACGAATATKNQAGAAGGATGSAGATSTQRSSSGTSIATPTPTPAASQSIDFNLTVAPIIVGSCGTVSCHGIGAAQTVYEANQQNFVSSGGDIVSRLNSTDPTQQMPLQGYLGYPGLQQLTSAQQATLLGYLAQEGVAGAATPTPVPSGSSGSQPTPTPAATPTPGPQQLRCSILTSAQIATGAAMTYAAFNTAVLVNDCAGGGCHSQGAGNDQFVNAPSGNINNDLAGMFIDVETGSMPQGKTMTDADKQILYEFACGHAGPF